MVLLTESAIALKSPATDIANFSVRLPLEIFSSILPISSVGFAIASIKLFKLSTISFQLPIAPDTEARSVNLPSVPATFATRLISVVTPPTISAILLYDSASSPYMSYRSFGSLIVVSPLLNASRASNKRFNCCFLYSSASPSSTLSSSSSITPFSPSSSTSSNKAFLPGFLILPISTSPFYKPKITILLISPAPNQPSLLPYPSPFNSSAIFLYATPALHFGL